MDFDPAGSDGFRRTLCERQTHTVPSLGSYRGQVVRKRVLVSGRVQGVFFRDTCQRVAVEHGVSGWVRNLTDGRVEAVFEGPADRVDRLVDWARHGPSHANVAEVSVLAEQPEGLTRFVIR